MAEFRDFNQFSPELSKPHQIEIFGNNNGQETSRVLFDSKQLIFGIFNSNHSSDTSTNTLLLTYNSLIKQLSDIKKSSPEKIKNTFSNIYLESLRSARDASNVFGVAIANNPNNYSIFVGSDKTNSVNIFCHNKINQATAISSKYLNKSDPFFSFYSFEINPGDVVFVTKPILSENQLDKKITNFIEQKQKESLIKVSQLTKIISSQIPGKAVVVLRFQ